MAIPAVVRGLFGRARKQLATLGSRTAVVLAAATTVGKVMAAAVEVYPNIASVVLLMILA